MVIRGTPSPNKLIKDSILEAILEFRFASAPIPEVLYGRLIDHKYWTQFQQRKTPFSEIPAFIRSQDPNMRYFPAIELISPDATCAIRMGPFSLSYHQKEPYPGWNSFRSEIEKLTSCLFEITQNLQIERIGLRYTNALTQEFHGISTVTDLDVEIAAGKEPIATNFNLNFIRQLSSTLSCMVRVATKEFVQGHIPGKTSLYVDVDVFTNEEFRCSDRKKIDELIESAHNFEKDEFFHLFKEDTINQLREE